MSRKVSSGGHDVSTKQACLYVIATPIGNLRDISQRAIETLSGVDAILCEDTRHSGKLLAELGIRKPMISLHDHNERARIEQVLARLQAGESLALISDAGTPLISDPGFPLVRALRQAGVPVLPIPGANAVITALSAAGLPTDRFSFEGFLPAKSGARRELLESLANDPRTLVFYESPRRLAAMLADVASVIDADREVVVARELTKLHEEFIQGMAGELAVSLADREIKGECVVMIAGARKQSKSLAMDAEKVLRVLLKELPASKAAKVAAQLTGESRKELYALASRLSGNGTEENNA